MSNRAFLQHFLMNVGLGVGFFWLWQFGYIQSIYHTDVSYTTSINLGITLLFSLLIGYATLVYRESREFTTKLIDAGWFFASQVQAIAIVGTVIGLIALFQQKLSGFNVNDPTSMMELLKNAFSSLGVVFYTTAVGMGLSVIIKIMTYHLEQFHEDSVKYVETEEEFDALF